MPRNCIADPSGTVTMSPNNWDVLPVIFRDEMGFNARPEIVNIQLIPYGEHWNAIENATFRSVILNREWKN
jgi:hypothetical protein